jgi:hypothetical protein
MNIEQFGLALRSKFPGFSELNLGDEELARLVLNRYPDLYDLLSPSARRIKALSDADTSSFAWTERGRIEKRAGHIRNNRDEAAALHEMDMFIEASLRKVPREALADLVKLEQAQKLQIELETARTDLELKKYWETARLDLDAADRSDLKGNHQLAWLDSQLTGLYRRREQLTGLLTKSAKDELRLVNRRIKIHERQVDAIGQTLVPPPDGQGVFRDGSSPDGGAGGPEASSATEEPLPSEKHRAGF